MLIFSNLGPYGESHTILNTQSTSTHRHNAVLDDFVTLTTPYEILLSFRPRGESHWSQDAGQSRWARQSAEGDPHGGAAEEEGGHPIRGQRHGKEVPPPLPPIKSTKQSNDNSTQQSLSVFCSLMSGVWCLLTVV
jgi:hypothetical protein